MDLCSRKSRLLKKLFNVFPPSSPQPPPLFSEQIANLGFSVGEDETGQEDETSGRGEQNRNGR